MMLNEADMQKTWGSALSRDHVRHCWVSTFRQVMIPMSQPAFVVEVSDELLAHLTRECRVVYMTGGADAEFVGVLLDKDGYEELRSRMEG